MPRVVLVFSAVALTLSAALFLSQKSAVAVGIGAAGVVGSLVFLSIAARRARRARRQGEKGGTRREPPM